jgi:hypothetical protein
MRKRINRLNGGGRTLLMDTFTDADGATLPGHAADDGVIWADGTTGSSSQGSIQSNRLTTIEAGSSAAHFLRGSRLRRRNGAAYMDLIRVSAADANTSQVQLLLRHASRQQGALIRWHMAFSYDTSSTGSVARWRIIRNGGTVLSGATVNVVLTQDQVYRVKAEVRGSRFLLWIDGVLTINVEDANPIKNFMGLRHQYSAAGEGCLRVDNWMATR